MEKKKKKKIENRKYAILRESKTMNERNKKRK